MPGRVKTYLSFLVFFFLVFSSALFPQSNNTSNAPKLEHFDTKYADRSLDPCQDFYKFACNKWMAANPVPPDETFWGPQNPLQLWTDTLLRQILEQASAKRTGRSFVEQKIGDYYSACMDEKAINTAGQTVLKPEFDRIAALKSKSGLAAEIAHLHKSFPKAWAIQNGETVAAVFGFAGFADFDNAAQAVAYLDQGGMALPGRQFYLDTDSYSAEIRGKYLQHIRKMFGLAGENPGQADADARAVLELETGLAQNAMDEVKRRDPAKLNNKMSLRQVEAITPSFNWKEYLQAVDAPRSPHYIVTSPDFFRGLEKLIQQHPLEHWRAYLRWNVLHGSAEALPDSFVQENFEFFGRTLSGAQQLLPRWRRCVRSVDRDLGDALGQAYVARAFPPASKQRVQVMVLAIEAALKQDIHTLDWMSVPTKRQAEIKLAAIENKIGYPARWKNYSSVRIAANKYLNNMQQCTNFEFERWVHKIGKPVDRNEWTMTPPTINAYYDAPRNSINFLAGILQPPFFDPLSDDPTVYGGIGKVIGHEIIHGFDDQGRKFDAHGNLRDWWTAEDVAAYTQRSECIAEEYTQDVPEAGAKQNGKLTHGEDIADNGGIRLALKALKKILEQEKINSGAKDKNGFTPEQMFFLSYAFSFCINVRPEIMRTLVLTDPHSLPKYRVNNVLANMPEFQQAFSCLATAPMIHKNACRVW